jgi:hypothetical protein
MTPAELVQAWRQQAAAYDRDGQPGARLLARCADELEAALATTDNPLLALDAAANRSGYHRESLARMVRKGSLRNYGTPRRPLVRAADLPRKATRPRLTAARGALLSTAQ